MGHSLRLVALAALVAALNSAASAKTPGPPDWQDSGRSVYLPSATNQQRTDDISAPLAKSALSAATSVEKVSQTVAKPSGTAPATASLKKFDSNVVPSAYVEPPLHDEPSRQMAPPSDRESVADLTSPSGGHRSSSRRLFNFGIPTHSIYTIVTALTTVIGTFLLFVWLLRRGTRRASGRGNVPTEAVSTLGRVRLTGRQMAELLRVGNKLVLVALTPGGPETITEVTDPAEVDRLVGLCQQQHQHSATNAFESVFQNFSREESDDGFAADDAFPPSISPIAAAYRSHRGGIARV